MSKYCSGTQCYTRIQEGTDPPYCNKCKPLDDIPTDLTNDFPQPYAPSTYLPPTTGSNLSPALAARPAARPTRDEASSVVSLCSYTLFNTSGDESTSAKSSV